MKILTIKAKDTDSGSQNTYIIEDDNCCVMIDAGVSIAKVKEYTTLPVKGVLITHCHYDHIEYIEDYDKEGIPIYLSKSCADLLDNIKANASDLFDNPKTFKISNLKLLEDKQKFKIEGMKFIFYSTPGHTIDGGCFFLENGQSLFTGDTLFEAGIGRVDLPTGSADNLKQSLEKISQIDFEKLYPGHGEISNKSTQDKLIPKWQRYLNIIR